MKPHIYYLIALIFVLGSFSATAQTRPVFPKVKRDVIAQKPVPGSDNTPVVIGSQKYNPTVSVKSALDDPSTMVTTYDLQTNASDMPRIYRYPDATIGTISTWSATTSGTTFPDRGTGYNYFNGSSWRAQPTARIETAVRTGWPSYAPFGSTGEITISHNVVAGASLIMSMRNTKGAGTWTVTQPSGLGPPPGAAVMSWPRMVTNGNPRTRIHIIALTEPVANGGTAYLGMDGALLYNRSNDGGNSWTGWQQLAGMTASEYKGFGADGYAWAEPRGDTLCFVVGNNWNDEFIMKSTDNGSTWTKTKIWTCPYDLWPGNVATDTFYCSDGSSSVALDHNGKAHVAFGRQRALGDNTGAKFYFPFTDGLIYWDETMPELPQTLDDDNIFIAWVKDTMVFYQAATQLAYYYTSMSSYPTMVIDNNDYIFVVYSSVTLLLDPNSYMLRHLFARASIDNGVTWRDSLVEITSNFFQYHFEECVYPSASPTSTDSLFVLFQGDVEGGVFFNGSNGAQGQVDITNNDLLLIKPAKSDIIMWGVGVDQEKNQPAMLVSQNSPNPFRDRTYIDVQLNKPGSLLLDVYAITGQRVLEINKGTVNAGISRFILHSSQLNPGVYFYTVRSNGEASTRKMIVE